MLNRNNLHPFFLIAHSLRDLIKLGSNATAIYGYIALVNAIHCLPVLEAKALSFSISENYRAQPF